MSEDSRCQNGRGAQKAMRKCEQQTHSAVCHWQRHSTGLFREEGRMIKIFVNNFLGKAPAWYKFTILGFLIINPVIFFLEVIS